jgi:PAS domain S-box-containing protein
MARKRISAQPSGYTILIVDDQEEALISGRFLLEKEGHRVMTATGGQEALARVRPGQVHLVIVDYFMPGMSGEKLVQEIRKLDKEVQILLQTGYSREKPPREMLRFLDIQGYHDKSEGPEHLLLWVDVALKASTQLKLANQRWRDLKVEIARRQRTEEALRRAHNELELRVQERTAGLVKANQALQAEIVERRQAEKALRESEERYRSLFEDANEAILTYALDGTITNMNRMAELMLGWSRKELIGQHYRKLLIPSSVALTEERTRRALAGERLPPIFEAEVMHKDGSVMPIEARSCFIRDQEGKPIGFQTIYHDTAEQKQWEQAALLQLSQTFLTTLDPQAVMEQAVETTSRVLREKRILFLLLPHETCEKMMVCCARGWTKDMLGLEISLRGWQEAGTEYALQQQKPVLIDDLATEGCFHFHPAAIAEGVRSAVAVPVMAKRKPLGAMVVCSLEPSRFTAVDIHLLSLIANQTAMALERAQLYYRVRTFSAELEQKVEERTQELREVQRELVHKEKLATLGQLASSMGHEMRQPLSVMTNALYYLRTKLQKTDSDVKDYLGILQNEVRVAEKIVADLLDSARIRPPQRQAVAVGELVADQIARLPLPSAVTVEQDFPLELPPVCVDSVQIGQVISNLLKNALEAMGKQGGTLTFAGAQLGDSQVMLSVTDTGEGIPKGNLEKIFEPLFTTKARGIGLGLSVCKGLVQANGGELWVQSRVGEGSTFTLVLPVAREQP